MGDQEQHGVMRLGWVVGTAGPSTIPGMTAGLMANGIRPALSNGFQAVSVACHPWISPSMDNPAVHGWKELTSTLHTFRR